VIIAGGAGKPDHFVEVFSSSPVSAAAAGNFFHFTEHSVIKTKAAIHKRNIDVRLETHANYADAEIDSNNRLHKKSDEILDKLLYLKIEKEII
jgi:cyclase